jgi:hypothetical protein
MDCLKEKCQIVMLPTNSLTTKLYRSKFEDKLYYNDGVGNLNRRFYLYICSDREIKEGDWCIYKNKFGATHLCKAFKEKPWNNDGKTVSRMLYKASWHSLEIDEGITPLPDEIFKIEASTDKSLSLPTPSKEFIQKYVEKYNEGNSIREVLVEMSDTITTCPECAYVMSYDAMRCTNCNTEMIDFNTERISPPVVYVKPDNTITISRVEETWNDIFKFLGIIPNQYAWTKKLEENYSVPKKLKQ